MIDDEIVVFASPLLACDSPDGKKRRDSRGDSHATRHATILRLVPVDKGDVFAKVVRYRDHLGIFPQPYSHLGPVVHVTPSVRG